MAYDGGYGDQQRPYAGYAAQPPTPRGGSFPRGPPPPPQQQQQQYDAPQQFNGYDNGYDNGYGYGYDDYGAASGQNPREQFQDSNYGREPTPPQHDYMSQPPPGRGGGHQGRPPPDRYENHHEVSRTGSYPPRQRGGMRPPPGRGRGGGRPGPPPGPDTYGGGRPRVNNGPQSPVDGSFSQQYPGTTRRQDPYEEERMTDRMAGMNLNRQMSHSTFNGRTSSESQQSYGDYGRPMNANRGPPPRGYQPQDNYPGAGRMPLSGQASGPYDNYQENSHDSRGQAPPAQDFGPPARSMTAPLRPMDSRHNMRPPPQRTETYQYDAPGAYGAPQRPSTASGHRPPQQTYPPSNQQPSSPGSYGGGYYDGASYGQQPPSVSREVFDSYRHDANSNAPGHNHRRQQSSLPDFNSIPAGAHRGSFEETMRSGNEQPQRGPHGTPQLHHAKSMADVQEPQSAVFEMAGDIPSVPPVPPAVPQQPRYEHYDTPNAYSQMPVRGPSAPPNPAQGMRPGGNNGPSNTPTPMRPSNIASSKSADTLPSHPTPVRPGLMANSMVNMNDKPPPVRNYGAVPQSGPPQNNTGPPGQPPQQAQYQQAQYQQAQPPPPQQAAQRLVSRAQQPKPRDPPVTAQELESLRMSIKANPNDQESALRLAKRLIEAADILAPALQDPKARLRGRERYLMDAHKVLKKLSNSQNRDAMFILADGVGRGLFGQMPDSKEAFTLYQSAAKLGHAAGAYRTAVCCEIGQEDGGGTRRDPLKAMQWYKRSATLGDTPAMYKVGMILLKGLLGQTKNHREAVVWLKRAAEQADSDNPHALHELGLLYESASPTDALIRDEGYALELFQQAADLGYKFSQFRLGCVYEYGLMGCMIDPRLSIVWYSRAAQQEEHQSELALAGWYLTGSPGVLAPNDAEAYLWARKAAVAGLAKAEYAMGYFTETAIGTARNMEDAKRWYWRAAAQDFTQARKRLEDLKRGGKNPEPRQRERISRGQMDRRQEGDCTIM